MKDQIKIIDEVHSLAMSNKKELDKIQIEIIRSRVANLEEEIRAKGEKGIVNQLEIESKSAKTRLTELEHRFEEVKLNSRENLASIKDMSLTVKLFIVN